MIKRLLSLALALTASVTVLTAQTSNNKKESLIFCDEGGWQQNNGQLSFYNGTTSTLTNKWFEQVNGKRLGDTPNDIIQINDTLVAICVNWSMAPRVEPQKTYPTTAKWLPTAAICTLHRMLIT